VAADKTLVAVEVQVRSDFDTGAATPLFRTQIRSMDIGFQYDVSADGQRFLVNTIAPEENSAITVVQNWTAGLKKELALAAGTRLGPYEGLAPLGAEGWARSTRRATRVWTASRSMPSPPTAGSSLSSGPARRRPRLWSSCRTGPRR